MFRTWNWTSTKGNFQMENDVLIRSGYCVLWASLLESNEQTNRKNNSELKENLDDMHVAYTNMMWECAKFHYKLLSNYNNWKNTTNNNASQFFLSFRLLLFIEDRTYLLANHWPSHSMCNVVHGIIIYSNIILVLLTIYYR